jgi:hypothetical protein
MKRLIIVYNPRSSHFAKVEREVLSKARGLKGWAVGKFEVAETNVDENAHRLAKIFQNDDLVVAAGGDGTATIAVNAIMLSEAQNVRLGVMGFGNFNDTARSFGLLRFEEILKGDAREVWPLECKVNKEHWRYGMCYFTIGMFAEACAAFDHPKTRKALQGGKKRTSYSLWVLVKWWLRQRRKHQLPNFALGGASGEYIECKHKSDYMAVNGKTVAKMMKGGKYYLSKDGFLSYNGQMTKFFKLSFMMAKSILRHVPGTESDYDCLVFPRPAKMMIQAEGEYHKFTDVEIIEISKAKKPLLAIVK